MADDLERQIRRAFARRLAATPAPPDLRSRISAAAAKRTSRSSAWLAVAATVAVLVVGAGTFYALVARHSGRTPTIVGPTPSPSPSAAAPPSPSPTSSPSHAPLSYGVLMATGHIELITPSGTLAASAPMTGPSVQSPCGQDLAVSLATPVSATNSQVYFRDGDTKIRYLTPTGQTGDATAVPGNASTVSFFSVSPDDQRIAVVVEDISQPNSISLRLYVEDLSGGGHHVDLSSTSTPKGVNGTSLWPVGWHQGALVLAVMPACTSDPRSLRPSEYDVVNPATGQRVATIVATISGAHCILSLAPSPAGVTCIQPGGNTNYIIDWKGIARWIPAFDTRGLSGLSPSGDKIYYTYSPGSNVIGATNIAVRINGVWSAVNEHEACGWIDDNHLLGTDAVIDASIGQAGFPTGTVTPLGHFGSCAGRVPGEL